MTVNISNRFLFFVALLSFLSLVFFTGCGGSNLFSPKAIMKLTTVPANPIVPAAADADFDSIEATFQTIGWSVLNNTGVELKGWSANYTSAQGEALPTINIPYRKSFARTEGGQAGTIQVNVFHGGVIDLMRATTYTVPFTNPNNDGETKLRSIISPVNCHLSLYFNDDHGNEIILETDIPLQFSDEG